jgi:hypothetical protein
MTCRVVSQLQHCVSEPWSVRAAELCAQGGMRGPLGYVRRAARYLRHDHNAFLVKVVRITPTPTGIDKAMLCNRNIGNKVDFRSLSLCMLAHSRLLKCKPWLFNYSTKLKFAFIKICMLVRLNYYNVHTKILFMELQRNTFTEFFSPNTWTLSL